jgi:hypothetical protein
MCLLWKCQVCGALTDRGHFAGCPLAARLAAMHETPDYTNAPIELDPGEEEE